MAATTAAPAYAGVDIHKDTNTLGLIDSLGRVIGTWEFPTGEAGYARLERAIGDASVPVGIEGTGSYGAGLAAHLRGCGYDVYEVVRPKRGQRRRGKSDPIDALAAARNLAWFAQHLMSIQTPPFTDPAQLGARFGQSAQNAAKGAQHVVGKGMVPWFENAVMPIFDMLWLIRSMEEFVMDLYDCPGEIMDIVNKYQPIEDEKAIQMMKQAGMTRVAIFPMRDSATFMSTDMFEEFAWPWLRDSISRYAAAGLTTIIHADGNWLPMLPYFNELPRGCCHFELDGVTDIEKAYGILQGHHSIRGDIPATILAFGTEDETKEYCEKLVQMGMGGGFMLASGCEVPINAKLENLKAFVNFVK